MREPGTTTGVLIVGHGTASAVGAEECRRVAAMVAELLPALRVELGFLEIIEPSIDAAMDSMAAAGCREVVVVPILLFAAGHARRDVPEAVIRAAEARGIATRQAGVIGCHEAVVELARLRHREAVAGRPPVAPTRIVVVGRGASDPSAESQLRAFAEAAFEDAFGGAASVGLGFVAAARPTLDEAIAVAAAEAGDGRVVVHPHLLFHGHVETQVAERIERARREHPAIDWVVVGRLGADRRVAKAVAERARQAIAGDARMPGHGGVPGRHGPSDSASHETR